MKKFSVKERIQSFGYAIEGLFAFFRTEHNAWIHLCATIGVAVMALLFPVSSTEIVALVIVVGMVWVAEIFNTAIEKAMDVYSTKRDPKIKLVKDLAAGAVLVAAVTALTVGLIIFIPKI